MDISNYNQEDFNATYSPEDNKLRLYADVRIDSDDWQEMKTNGWKWAPKQELFVCYWSINNEDFCLAIAGDIMPEQMTMVERAEFKADRLLILAQKRSTQCIGYQKAANELMMRIDHNQPILSGHHSQRKAEKTELQVKRNIEKAEETASAVSYWVLRARGVIGHADYKNNTRTIYNRIKTLLKDLRTNQRYINDAASSLNTLIKISNNQDIEIKNKHISTMSGYGYSFRFNCYDDLRDEKITHDQALNSMIETCNNMINSKGRARIINHLLNRLAYEQEQLSLVPLFGETITPAVLQTFLRTHGSDKPKVSKTDFGWLAVSSVCLPLHINSSSELELDDQAWCELMQSVGYEVPAKRTVAKKPPILNFRTSKKFIRHIGCNTKELEQVELTKEEYKNIGADYKRTGLSDCGLFRYRFGFVKIGVDKWGSPDYEYKAVFISDSKVHPTPESMLTSEV